MNEPPFPDPVPEAAGLPEPDFLVVGLGGSAGAFEAFSELLRGLPSDAGLAIIVVQHLSSEHESLLVDLLVRVSKLPTTWAGDGTLVKAGHVYVLPPKSGLVFRDGRLLAEPGDARPAASVIDVLFRSLADSARHRAVGVLCSGNGADGVHGLKAIKAAGGVTFGQNEATAAFPSMPRAAAEADCLDNMLAPREIAAELVRLAEQSRGTWRRMASAGGDQGEWGTDALRSVFRLVATRRGLDFTHYKPSTIKRRLFRRMLLTKTRQIADYVTLLTANPDEVDALYESLLINVTEFFRDPDTFEFLGRQVLPALFEKLADRAPIRVWVPGCATGEEAYSLGMLIQEVLDGSGAQHPVQIFGTDMSDRAIATARAGVFSAADVAAISPDRIRRFFDQREGRYLVQKSIRDMCIFARQNVVRDAPFSKLDLISCRNLLIYLDVTLQHKVLPIFHYALKPTGVLSLGNSESSGGFSDLFRLVDRRFRIYSRKSSDRRTSFEFSPGQFQSEKALPLIPAPSMADESREPTDMIREADRVVLERHAPPGVLISDKFEIHHFRGDVGFYLTPSPGRASLNLIAMARDGLAGELEAAVLEAREKNVRVRREGVTVVNKDEVRRIEIDVSPIESTPGKGRCYLVLFVPAAPAVVVEGAPGARPIQPADNAAYLAQIAQLNQELQTARRHLHATVEKHQSANEEVRTANEEIQSSNEELQSTNEELETAKEELQSTNEELTTVNQELHSRHLELIQLNNDLTNLINSVHLPIIILGEDMRIRRFTPSAEKVLNLIPSDVGRPLSDINIKLNLPELPRLIADVMTSLTLCEREVRDGAGRWLSIRIRPYKTADNKIEGAVVSIIDIDQMKRAFAQAQEAREIADAIINAAPEPLVALNDKLEIRSANEAFARFFGKTAEPLVGRSFLDLFNNPEEADALRRALVEILPEKASLLNFRVHLGYSIPTAKELFLNARQIVRGDRVYPLILVSFHRSDGAQG